MDGRQISKLKNVHEEMEQYNADFAAAVSVLHYVAAAITFAAAVFSYCYGCYS